ncbi:MAG: hypothetical protein ACI978_002212 [Oleispira sp.]|jgi:hypothetical protein
MSGDSMSTDNNKKGTLDMSQASRDYSEKRDFIRMQVTTDSQIHFKGQSFAAKCIDLSSTGALIESEQSFEVNSEVVLSIQSGGGETPALQAQATILRICRMPNDCYQYGTSIDKYL